MSVSVTFQGILGSWQCPYFLKKKDQTSTACLYCKKCKYNRLVAKFCKHSGMLQNFEKTHSWMALWESNKVPYILSFSVLTSLILKRPKMNQPFILKLQIIGLKCLRKRFTFENCTQTFCSLHTPGNVRGWKTWEQESFQALKDTAENKVGQCLTEKYGSR